MTLGAGILFLQQDEWRATPACPGPAGGVSPCPSC